MEWYGENWAERRGLIIRSMLNPHIERTPRLQERHKIILLEHIADAKPYAAIGRGMYPRLTRERVRQLEAWALREIYRDFDEENDIGFDKTGNLS